MPSEPTTHTDAAEPLKVWNTVAEAAKWGSIAEVRLTIPQADFVDPFTVFNFTGNTYRLIVKIEYRFARIYINTSLRTLSTIRGMEKMTAVLDNMTYVKALAEYSPRPIHDDAENARATAMLEKIDALEKSHA